MTAAVLQAFLRLNLVELGGEDARKDKLLAAGKKLSSQFAEDPVSAIPVFLAAIRSGDDSIGGEFEVVAAAIELEWPTYHGAFKEGAQTLYRAVALQAIELAIAEHPKLGVAVSLLMRNLAPLLEFGKTAPAMQLLFDAANSASDERCAELSGRASRQDVTLSAAKFQKVDRTALQKRIEGAAGPHNPSGNASTDGPNPHWPNAGHPWSYEFSSRLTAILGDYFDNILGKASDMDAKNLAAVGGGLSTLRSGETHAEGATALLWWRQALYSESASKPYRELAPADLVVHAVVDLSKLVSPSYDRSLESFLSEAVLHLGLPKDGELSGVSAQAVKVLDDELKHVAPKGLVVASLVTPGQDELVARPSMTYPQWAVWLLREVMALKAVEEPDSSSEATSS